MSSRESSTRGAINAADLAVAEGDLFTAEEALQEALRKVREQQTQTEGETHADD